MAHFTMLVLLAVQGPPAIVPSPNPWEEVEDSNGIRVWARRVPGSSVLEVRAEVVVKKPATRLWEVLSKVEEYVEFMPYLVESRVVGSAGENAQYEYQLVDPPIVSRRDYTLKVVIEEHADAGLYRRWFVLANDKGPPPREDVVRVQVCKGRWMVESLGAGSSRVEYRVSADPGGLIPKWIARRSTRVSVVDMLDALRNRALDPKWKKD